MKVKFMPQNIEVEVTPDKSLLQLATENNIEIKSICKGVPSCAECRVRILEGEGNILPPGKAELNLIGTSYFIDSRRLSCQVRCYGDVTVDLTEQIERQENQVKKTRGFRSTKPIESKAVQDTMILNPGEKVEDIRGEPKAEPRNDSSRNDNRGGGGGRNNQPRAEASGSGGGEKREGRSGRGRRGGRGGNRSGGAGPQGAGGQAGGNRGNNPRTEAPKPTDRK